MNKKTRTREDIRRPVEPKPMSRNFVPPEASCSTCVSTRPKDKNYTSVYGTIPGQLGITRYCRCGWCGNTFKMFTKYEATEAND
jgi:hypothetical protein